MPDERHADRLTLTIDWPEITLDRLSRITSLWSRIVQSVSVEAAGRKQAIKWVITEVHFGSPLTFEALPEVVGDRVDPDVINQVAHAIVSGIDHLETHPDEPEYFTSHTLGNAKALALLTDPEKQRRILVSNGVGKQVELSTNTAATVDRIFGPTLESYGSVEGQLEGLITHGKQRFYVYESLTGKQVRCLFDSDTIPLSEILKGFDRRVSVSGLIKSKALTGERLSIVASQFSILPADDTLMTTDDIRRLWGRS